MKIKEGFILRKVADYSIVVAVDQASKDFNGMINLNDTGAFLWKLLEEEATREGLLEAVLNEYDVDEKTARDAIDQFLKKLSEAGLLAKEE